MGGQSYFDTQFFIDWDIPVSIEFKLTFLQ